MAFAFRGKSGKEHFVTVDDRRLARIVQRCQTLPGEQLFPFIDDDGNRQDIDSVHVNEYLRAVAGPEVTAKVGKARVPIVEVPIAYTARDHDEGKKVRWTDGFEAMWVLIKHRLRR